MKRLHTWGLVGQLITLVGLVISLISALPAHADTGLLRACYAPNPTQYSFSTANDCPVASKGWARVTEPVAFLSSSAGAPAFDNPDSKYRLFTDIPAAGQVTSCSADIPAGIMAGTDPCPDASKVIVARPAAPAAGTGTALLAWTPPTQNTDGTAITDLQGIQVTYGQTNPPTTALPLILAPAAKNYTFNTLGAGVWYFTVAAVNTGGISSAPSPVVSKTILALTPPTISLTATPKDNVATATPTLVWSTQNAGACTASGGWTGAKPVNGSATQAGVTTNTTYSLSCVGPGGSATVSVDVNVSKRPAPPTAVTVK